MLALLAGCATQPKLRVENLRTDGRVAPLGVDSAPRLSWAPSSTARGAAQSAYQILASSSADMLAQDKGDLWDSGRIASDETLNIAYLGQRPMTDQKVFWKVRAWNERGKPSPWSAPSAWVAGIVSSDGASGAKNAPPGWHAAWITDPDLLPWQRPSLGFRSQDASDPATVKWIQLDLGRTEPIEAVRLDALRYDVVEGTGFPRRFKVEAADDPTMAGAIVMADFTEKDFGTPGALRADLPAQPDTAARYLRITATRLRVEEGVACLAFSQVEVISAGKNIAPGATVTASDSVERMPWSAASAVDGLGVPGTNPAGNATRLLRREFNVRSGLKRAVFNVCGLGEYVLSVNGKRIGDALFSPGWTNYDRTHLYDTFDITEQLRSGANAAGICLAGGMFNVQPSERYTKFVSRFRPLTVIAQLQLEYSDGSIEFVGTDSAWRVAPGPVTYASVYGGEDYDARLEPVGWNRSDFDDAAWRFAVEMKVPPNELRGASFEAPPIRTHEALMAVKITELHPGMSIYDLGQNAALLPHLRAHGPAGSTVRITPAELLNPDGSLDRESVGGGQAYWQLMLRGDPAGEAWAPDFFYQGARYLQVERLPPTPGGELPIVDELEGMVVHGDVAAVGDFACSNELFNRIRTLIRWAQRSNIMSILTDCPQRERLGWLEQTYLNGPSLRYEFDVAPVVAKALNDMEDSQRPDGLVPDIAPEYIKFSGGFRDSPEWGSAIIQCAWQQYLWTGDTTPLARQYDAMKQYVAYLDHKRDGNGLLNFGLGDWFDLGPGKAGRAQLTPIALTATAIYFSDLAVMEKAALAIGRSDEAPDFARRAAEIRAAFNRAFFDRARGTYATGSQTANAMPLVLGLVEKAEAPRVLAALVSDVQSRGDALTAGDVGYTYLLQALAAGGRSDLIFAMNNRSDRPGYGYQLKKGATALTEAWDAAPASSQDHFMLGHIMDWFYHDVGGIGCDPTGPGFKKILIQPSIVGDLTWARTSYDSVRGRIGCEWRLDHGRLLLRVTIPSNTTATIRVPTSDPANVREGNRPAAESDGVRPLHSEANAAIFAVGSGVYEFTAAAPAVHSPISSAP